MITGLIAPLLTPFDDNLALDQEKFNALAKRLLDTGCSGWHRLAQLARRYQSAMENARWRLKAW